jgi:hypothetical protein
MPPSEKSCCYWRRSITEAFWETQRLVLLEPFGDKLNLRKPKSANVSVPATPDSCGNNLSIDSASLFAGTNLRARKGYRITESPKPILVLPSAGIKRGNWYHLITSPAGLH